MQVEVDQMLSAARAERDAIEPGERAQQRVMQLEARIRQLEAVSSGFYKSSNPVKNIQVAARVGLSAHALYHLYNLTKDNTYTKIIEATNANNREHSSSR